MDYPALNQLKNPKENYPIKKLRVRNLLKLYISTKKSGSGYVGGATRFFKPQKDLKNIVYRTTINIFILSIASEDYK